MIYDKCVGFSATDVVGVKGKARTQSPTIINYAPELPTFGVIAGVSPTEVQWKGLALGELPS